MAFLIYALPRSRTAWLSKFLSYKDWICQHEHAQYLRTIADIKDFFSYPRIGSVETGAAPGRSLLKCMFPELKEVVILRPVNEVIESLMKIDLSGIAVYDRELLEKGMRYCDRAIHKIAADSKVLTIHYHELNQRDTCIKIFEHCLPYEFDDEWWESLKDVNIQEDTRKMMEYRIKNRDRILTFKKNCKSELRRLYRLGLFSQEVRI